MFLSTDIEHPFESTPLSIWDHSSLSAVQKKKGHIAKKKPPGLFMTEG